MINHARRKTDVRNSKVKAESCRLFYCTILQQITCFIGVLLCDNIYKPPAFKCYILQKRPISNGYPCCTVGPAANQTGESGWLMLYAKAPKVTWGSLLLPFFLTCPATQTSTAGFCLPEYKALSVCWCGPPTCGRRWHTCPSAGGRWSHPVSI